MIVNEKCNVHVIIKCFTLRAYPPHTLITMDQEDHDKNKFRNKVWWKGT